MRILFISRATLWSAQGGDTIQMEQTAAALRRLGISVDIRRTDDPGILYESYNLIHFFNIIRPADIIMHIERSGLPYVVSSIYVEYDNAQQFGRHLFAGKLFSRLSKNAQEYIKCLARAIKNGEQIVSRKYIYWGHRRSIEYILRHCSRLLPNSQSEYERLHRDFRHAGEYVVVPNAVDENLFFRDEGITKYDNTVLCVARFEPQKNQLRLIRALDNTPYHLTLAGNIAPNHKQYYEQCRKAAGNRVRFLDFLPQEELPNLYRRHKVHILPSWFETTGLASLEAAACGCSIVVSDKGDTRAYFGDNAVYCDPGNDENIVRAIEKAMRKEENVVFMEHIRQHYSWGKTARITFEVYQKVLNGCG